MGLFDTITWKHWLPYSDEMIAIGLNQDTWSFQTKDLDCCMAQYFVQDGKLFLQKHKIEEWVEGDPKAKDLMDRIGYLRQDEPYLELADITATLAMYDYQQNVIDKWDCWIEYEAVFINGCCSSVKLTRFEKKDNAPRLAQEAEFRERLDRENSVWYNRFIFHTKLWHPISRTLRRFTIASAELLYKISNHIP